ncbi:hypothetical protein EVAR_27125_1 [Eumeta japonica]|uniref:Uncharacterized protein n=1 Tax=Eumeta variegata TaxID=151549 RepID=A0A4C1W1H0_EUMVA|nr:hypothetical protein EVAR_27125_1 [Eumeta japonica]
MYVCYDTSSPLRVVDAHNDSARPTCERRAVRGRAAVTSGVCIKNGLGPTGRSKVAQVHQAAGWLLAPLGPCRSRSVCCRWVGSGVIVLKCESRASGTATAALGQSRRRRPAA